MNSTATPTTLAFSILKCSVNAMIIAFPAFQTFRVLEGRRLQDAHHMLTYWCVQCIVNATQNIADEMLGKYHLDKSYQTVCILLKLAPIIVGPEKLYNMFVRPFFLKQEKTLGVVADTAAHESEHAQKTLKQQGPITQKIAHEASHLKQSLKNATKELLDRNSNIPSPPSPTMDPTQVADALPSQPSNMTAQALSRWEQSREHPQHRPSHDDDPCCEHLPVDNEPITHCNLVHTLPKINEGVEKDEKEYDRDVKQESIVRRRVH